MKENNKLNVESAGMMWYAVNYMYLLIYIVFVELINLENNVPFLNGPI